MLSVKNLSQAKNLYTKLRRDYYLDAQPPHRVPPLAKNLVWRTDPTPSSMAETYFNDNGVAYEIRLSEWLMRSYTITRGVLLHELSHMRLGVDKSCGAWSDNWKGARVNRGTPWHHEAMRLASLGALHL